MVKKILIFAVVAFLILGVLGFWYWKKNPYSKDVLKIEIIGPSEVDFSEEVEYTVKYKNNGDVRLENPRLVFEFPENTLVDGGSVRRKEISPEELGDIYPGEEKTYSFKGRLFGKEQSLKTANVWLSYQPKNLNARYESQSSFTTKIKSVPLTFDFDLPSRIEANKDFEFSLNYYSVMDYPLSSLTVKTEYPAGFELKSSKPASINKNEWDIPLLNRAEGGRIEIQGKFSAELGEYKIFKAQLGMWRDGEFVLLKEINRGVEIMEPYLSIIQQVNSQADYVASPGDQLHYEISFRNVGEEPFRDLFLVARLEGSGFDFSTVRTQDGQFESGDNTIIWDWHDTPKLRFLDQGEEGKVEFWVKVKDGWDNQGKESVLKNAILISKVKQEFSIKVNSKLELNQQAILDGGANPPQAGTATTYNISWNVKNRLNNMKNVKVKAILPQNVRLTGNSSQDGSFAFDSQSREILWIVGDMQAGSADSSISFQAEITPFPNQKGQNASLIEQARIIGEDEWTQRSVEQKANSLFTPETVK
ncbi:MAG: hypothetical protein A2365_02210 [Candidatus Nealsonbacteria bacterium RIFOXYB1_FULL_40_15]|uniref:DUF11 domain-containing protein n=2 Tax=Candidatus Nealsoniibacteriota TaxID=1817911 RepID=A0A1G2EUP7_9BACT|nr:MAG: hypothetical protein A2365_02210 [Candidatus Nealsonbacteria bacterium RIFOXYB1_FULL_40_15]OGZ28468.1 MAG: hypothetical protein A2562_03290 [Candidatus Nealsonbacteria bacterium RIFOXYD1_FULL_39_11]OGZ29080.1 MAG: hypothetical protein A2427_02060 [Candidatus Nealsonbacteria bacterium RIFOXYC1_FULL_40_7]